MQTSRWRQGGVRRSGMWKRFKPARLVLAVAALLLLASACGAEGDTAESSSVADTAEPAADVVESELDAGAATGQDARGESIVAGDATDAAAEPAGAVSGGDGAQAQEPPVEGEIESPLGAGGTRVTTTAADLGRKLIFTASLNVEVVDVSAASAEATSIIESLGGFLFGQNTTGGPQASSELIFKVLPDDFNRALEQLGAVGELRNQSVTTDDVTERVVDLESRIGVAELGVARLRAALEGAATLEDYAQIERLLLDRESDLELMRGQLRTIQDRVDLATITLLLSQDRVENAIDLRISTYNDHDNGESCPGQNQNVIEADSKTTVCFDVVNVGDQTLTDIVLTDTVLEIDGDTQLIEVFGSLDELAPGQAALVAYEIKPERSLRLRTRVVAIPTDGISPEQAGPSVSTQVSYDIGVFEPNRDPGFGDGFSSALAILKGLWIGVVVVVGFLIPLLILLPVVWAAWWAYREIRRRRPPKPKPPTFSAGDGQPPPPPVPSAQPPVAAGAAAGGEPEAPGVGPSSPSAPAGSSGSD